jgi:hypothetical protein
LLLLVVEEKDFKLEVIEALLFCLRHRNMTVDSLDFCDVSEIHTEERKHVLERHQFILVVLELLFGEEAVLLLELVLEAWHVLHEFTLKQYLIRKSLIHEFSQH